MKDIEIRCASEEAALASVTEHFKMPAEAFEIVSVREGGEDDKLVVRLSINEDFLVKLIHDRVKGLLDNMEVSSEVRVSPGDEFYSVDILTRQGSLLIGRRGQTLDAIQHIVNRMISHHERNLPMILLDVENYRARSHRRLKQVARRASDRVLRTGRPVKLDPMTPHERKFIHKFLGEVKGVTTYSMGREGQRRVIVASEAPAKNSNGGDEELLPEFLNETDTYQPKRGIMRDESIRNLNVKSTSSNSGDAGDLLDPDLLDR